MTSSNARQRLEAVLEVLRQQRDLYLVQKGKLSQAEYDRRYKENTSENRSRTTPG